MVHRRTGGACWYPDGVLLRAYIAVAGLLIRLLGGRPRRLEEGPISLRYYSMGRAMGRRRGQGGESWVLLHGLGSVGATWIPLIWALRRDCRVLVPELSSLGGTRSPGGGLTVEQGAAMTARLIEEELDGRPATVVGLSLGGWMAVRLALSRPELVARLVLVDPAGYRQQEWERIEKLVAIDDLAGVDRLYPAMFGRTPWMMRWSRGSFLRAYTSPGVRSVLGALTEGDTYDQRDLARIEVPAALIWGERDGIFKLETGRTMAAALPRSRLYVLSGCGHAVHLECPSSLVGAIRRFRAETLSTTAGVSLPAQAFPPAAAAETRPLFSLDRRGGS